MIETTATIQGLARGMGGELLLTLSLSPVHIEGITKLKQEPVTIKIDKHRNKRSKDANAMMWAICRDIGEALHIPDREVYRKAIRDIGVYDTVPIKEERIEALERIWGAHGIGWFIEVEDKCKLPGFKRVRMYYGSSAYDSREMSALIDYLLDDAKQAGVVLKASPSEIAEAKRRWGENA